jgi:hypothetical protein
MNGGGMEIFNAAVLIAIAAIVIVLSRRRRAQR